MLAYCKANRRKTHFVVVSELSRFARNNEDQARTIADLSRIGVSLRSTYENNIDETAAGRLAANIYGTFNQYFSDALSEKMRDRTRQAVIAGRFPWQAPIGYRNVGEKNGANIVQDEERAPVIRRAFELMATGKYRKTDVLKIVGYEGLTTRKGVRLSAQTFQALLRNSLYVGWVTLRSEPNFEPVRGLHEPIVSQEIFDRVQAVLDGRRPGAAPKRKLNPDFPLKFVRCASCGTPLTGGFCKGRRKLYARYWCPKTTCRAVKLGREQLDQEFQKLLQQMRPHQDVIAKFPKIAARGWAANQGESEGAVRLLRHRLEEAKRRKQNSFFRCWTAQSPKPPL